ncbi:MAG TPA: globin family protein [Burkholderiales bacterium]|nr:globin family protein [Burkholderiales bacterium]
MRPAQVALVQDSWKEVLPIADTAAALFYGRLFALDPELKPLFRGDMKQQGRKLMAMMSVAVHGLGQPETIVPAVQDLGRRHAGYGVKDRHYASVGAALLWTLGQALGETFTPNVENAWSAAYGLLAQTMRDAARLSSA